MDIAKLLGTAAEVVSGVGGALGLGGSQSRAPAQFFTDILAQALGAGEQEGADAEAPALGDAIVGKVDTALTTLDTLSALATGTRQAAPTAPATTQTAEPVDVTATVARASAQALDLAIATALVTWADRSLGARGKDTFTIEGRSVDSLVAELPPSLRQAIEQTLKALDENGIAIPDGMMANLQAILGAVSVDTREVLSGPEGTSQAADMARSVTETVLRALAERPVSGQSVLQSAAQLAGAQVEGTAPPMSLEEAVGLLERVRENWEATAPDSRTLRVAVEELLNQLRGRVVHVLSETAQTGTPVTTNATASLPNVLAQPATATATVPATDQLATAVTAATDAPVVTAGAAVVEDPVLVAARKPATGVVSALRAVTRSVEPQVAGRTPILRLVDSRSGGTQVVPASGDAGAAQAAGGAVDADDGVSPIAVVSDAPRVVSTAKVPVWAPSAAGGTAQSGVLATAPTEAFGSGPAYADAEAVGTVGAAFASAASPGMTGAPLTEVGVGSGNGPPGTVRNARPVRMFGQPNRKADAGEAGARSPGGAVTAATTKATAATADSGGGQSVAIDTIERLFARPEPAKVTASKMTSDSVEPTSGTASLRSVAAPALSQNWSGDTSQRVKEVQRENGSMRVGVWNQLQRAVNETVSSGRNAVVIELKPPHLGDVRVTITASEQAVMAHFEAQSHTVRATLESNLNVLRDMLTNAGLSPDKLEVTVGFGGAGEQGAWKQQSQRDPGAFYRTFDPRHQTEAEALTTARALVATARSPYRSTAVVDLLA